MNEYAGGFMPKQEKLYTSQEGAYMTRLTLSSFRTKVSKLGIKGQRQGVKVFYTRKQLENVHSGVPKRKSKATKRIAKKRSKE
jgi:hypothetical protein